MMFDFQDSKLFWSSSKCEETVAAHEAANLSLDSLEPRTSTRLAFQVIDDGSEGLEIHTTSTVGAVIESLLV